MSVTPAAILAASITTSTPFRSATSSSPKTSALSTLAAAVAKSTKKGSKLSKGGIIGLAVGLAILAIILIIVAIVLFIFIKRSKARKAGAFQNQNPNATPGGYFAGNPPPPLQNQPQMAQAYGGGANMGYPAGPGPAQGGEGHVGLNSTFNNGAAAGTRRV